MADKLELALYWVLLAIFAVGRWAMSLRHVPYDRGNPVLSIVVQTFLSAVTFAAFARKWRGLVGNPLVIAIAASIGWVLGALLPEGKA